MSSSLGREIGHHLFFFLHPTPKVRAIFFKKLKISRGGGSVSNTLQGRRAAFNFPPPSYFMGNEKLCF